MTVSSAVGMFLSVMEVVFTQLKEQVIFQYVFAYYVVIAALKIIKAIMKDTGSIANSSRKDKFVERKMYGGGV